MERVYSILLMVFTPFIIALCAILYKRMKTKQTMQDLDSEEIRFKSNSDKIKVNLRDAEISSYIYSDKKENNTDVFESTINHIFFNKTYNDDNETHQATMRNEVTLKNVKYKNKILECSFVIYMDKAKLKSWFVFHSETYLYINSETDEQYLDLEFMNE